MEDLDLFKSEKLSRAVESTADAVVITDPGGTIAYVNPAFESITGFSREEAIGENPRILKSGLNSPETYKNMWDTLLKGKVWHGNVINRCKDGSIYHAEMTISPIRAHSGRILNYVGVQRDVTEKVRAQEEIRRRMEECIILHDVAKAINTTEPMECMLRNVLSALAKFSAIKARNQAGIFLADHESKTLQLFAHIGNFRTEFPENENRIPFGECLLGQVAASGDLLVRNNCSSDLLRSKWCQDVSAHGHCIVPLKSREQLVGVLCLYTDPSPPLNENSREILLSIGGVIADAIERHRWEDRILKKNIELQNLNELKNKFLGIASHDLRNPLYVIQSYSEVLLEGKYFGSLNEKQQNLVKHIFDSSTFMKTLLNELLDISMIESGKVLLLKQETDFSALVAERVELNQAIANKKQIKLDLSLDPIPPFPFDKNRIIQVIDELIGNAIKYSPMDTQIHVSTQKTPGRMKFSVTDKGPGISEKNQDLLFGEFQTLDAKPTGGEKSTGLGLAIVKKIIALHGGEVGVASKGKGSTFYFTLPL